MRSSEAARHYWSERHGLTKLRGTNDAAIETEDESRDALAKIRPTTSAGAAALIMRVIEDMRTGHNEWQEEALLNAVRGLRAMRRAV